MNHVRLREGGRIDPVIERLHTLYPRLMDLSLGRLQLLLEKMGNPERRLPPIVHVAGTNGKGSTCAMLRAMAEAEGRRVHVFTSPHLIRFNERYRVAGRLVDDETLADALEHVEQVNAGAPVTVFEVMTAAAFHLFSTHPAELCILEVGLGGRGDSTNVIDRPAASAITSISLDHRELLGDTLAAIATEKAGIVRHGIPLVTGEQPAEAMAVIRAAAGPTLRARNEAWTIEPSTTGLRYTDDAASFDVPTPSLPGPHQVDNAGIAIAALRAAGPVQPTAYAGLARATWPGRLQRLQGRLSARLPPGWELWLDGGHNPGAGAALAQHLASWADRPLHLVVGMKQSKDAAHFLAPLLPFATTTWAVAEPGQHLALSVEDIVAASLGIARPGPTVRDVIRQFPPGPPARVLVCGSLYLAGPILQSDGATIE